jgi:hypothetical protein
VRHPAHPAVEATHSEGEEFWAVGVIVGNVHRKLGFASEKEQARADTNDASARKKQGALFNNVRVKRSDLHS